MTTTYKEIKDGFNTFVRSALSVYGLSKKSPNGHKTNVYLTLNLSINIQKADFEEGGQFYGKKLDDFPESLKTVSTTEIIAGETILHVAINAAKPRALQFLLDIALERGELEMALIGINEQNKTPMENLKSAIKTYDDNIDKLSPLQGMDKYRERLGVCLTILTNTSNHLVYKSKWNKQKNTAKFLA